jgi:hypothetical protein
MGSNVASCIVGNGELEVDLESVTPALHKPQNCHQSYDFT